MPLTATNFVNKGPVLHNDLLQFFNLFTGVMVDQPVTFKNSVTVGGNQGTTTVPVKLYGAVGQTGHLLDLYQDNTQANPGWGVGALGQFGWGPGGASPQDTFLSRIALQNGHSTDTAGVFVQPYMEVSGGMGLDGALAWKTSGAALQEGAAGSLQVIVNQDLQARNLSLTGTVTSQGSVPNSALAADVARANLLTNGGFENWQRGNGAFTAANAYSADRWANSLDGTDALAVSRDNVNMDTGSTYCAAITYTKGTGTIYTALLQKFEGAAQLAGRTITFSARVRTATANVVRLSLQTAQNQSPSGATFTYSSYHSGSGAYQTLSVTSTLATNETTLFVNFNFNNASCTAFVDNAMLVVGSQPANYVPLHPADDLARCQRYYETLMQGSQSYVQFGYAPAGSLNTYFPTTYKVRKAVVPTVTKVGTFSVTNCAQPTIYSSDQTVTTLLAVSSAAGSVLFQSQSGVDGVTVEANP